MYRQGDVLIVPIKELPKGLKKLEPENGKLVLMHGEATGHTHAIAPRKDIKLCVIAANDNKYLVIVGDDNAVLFHQEHDPIEIPPGNYEIRRQREYNYWDDEVRYVAD